MLKPPNFEFVHQNDAAAGRSVHDRITFGYRYGKPAQKAWDAHTEGHGVCRDFAHLAVTMCRGMNVRARYCRPTTYQGREIPRNQPIARERSDGA